jgi:hypothetical protein
MNELDLEEEIKTQNSINKHESNSEQDASPSGVRLNASLVPNCHI